MEVQGLCYSPECFKGATYAQNIPNVSRLGLGLL